MFWEKKSTTADQNQVKSQCFHSHKWPKFSTDKNNQLKEGPLCQKKFNFMDNAAFLVSKLFNRQLITNCL